ncbi:cyclopropane-fatty-acyl-phospholipid synthase [Burkholderia cepacia]|uniref:Cyclopropane-fatty-acyl-phospholipid synthase n=1 Tax=Burkholderia cepacia TaxID=292 RepID=A0AAE8NLL8_BURCE|nr:class I SAM-dependent methyltransferase [Burkholderia cepacia]POM21375.1 Cyclopropane mycolic acid synthase 1 [Burkholderia cepacia]SQA59310.1 cyclopropane-fatty-acyl-phospholipid synthase [Burkholderia cepacia]
MTATASQPSPARMPAPGDTWLIRCCERGWLPDPLIRAGMRTLLRQRLRDEHLFDGERRTAAFDRLVHELNASPIAIDTHAANTQHYEVPGAFFEAHLGPRLKYSCGYYPHGNETLAQAEDAMLSLYAERAGLADGQRILDLGCGWGSLSLWLAERYPHARIVGLSNAHGQRNFIEQYAARRGLTNLRIVTGNVVDFDFAPGEAGFDRVLSIEMFEHMKNYGQLLAKIARWMHDDGKLFVHVFAHKLLAYHFAVRDDTDWMSRHFFTGGTMPSAHLLLWFQDDVRLDRQWWIDGTAYARTANHWLASLDAARGRIMPIFETVYGADARIWFQRWRMFYMAVAELFGYAGGQEWGIAHYLFDKRPVRA